jgi:hypothetical protein
MYRVDSSYVKHRCCWDTAVVLDCEEGKGDLGTNKLAVCDCYEEDAQFIADALNHAAKHSKARDKEYIDGCARRTDEPIPWRGAMIGVRDEEG